MNYKYLEEKMKTFFAEVDPQDLLKEFQEMGYEFESINAEENIGENIIDVSSVVQEMKNSDLNYNHLNKIPSKDNDSFSTENPDNQYDYSFAA